MTNFRKMLLALVAPGILLAPVPQLSAADVAQVGSTGYETLAEAVAATPEDGTVSVILDWPLAAISYSSTGVGCYDPRVTPVPTASALQTNVKVKRGSETAFRAIDAAGADADLSVAWSIASGAAIASVDPTGLVTFTGGGTAKVAVTVADGAGHAFSKTNSITYSPAICAIGSAVYSTLSAAIKAVQPGETVELLADAELTGILNRFTLDATKDFTLDLGGHVLTMNGAYFTLNGARLTIANGTITSKGNFSQEFTLNSGTLTIAADAAVATTGKVSAIGIFGPATVNVAGDVSSQNAFAIAGSGNAGKGGYTVNVTGGSVTSTGASAIYHPNEGTVNITGGSVTGATAVYQKCGVLNVAGGVLRGTGAATAYSYNGNGANATGDALVVDNCGYPGGTPSVSVTGGSFVSENARAVGSYANGDDAETGAAREPVGAFISGGTFSDAPDAVLLADHYAAQDNGDGTTSVVRDDPLTAISYSSTGVGCYDPRVTPVPTASALQTNVKVKRGSETAFRAIDAAGADADLSVAWSIASGAAIASVDPTGLVTFTGGGTAKVAVTVADGAGHAFSKTNSITYSPAICAIGSAVYSTLSAAIKAVQPGETVELLADAELTGILNRFTLDATKDFTLDLGGHVLTMNGAYFTLNGARLTIANGTITSKGNFSQEFTLNSGTLTIAADAAVATTGKVSAIGIFGPATVNVAGDVSSQNAFAIAGSGNAGKGGYTVNVTGGSVTSTGASAIYHPNEGTVNITGGSVTGATAVYQKCGVLNVAGGVLRGTGAATAYSYNGNGANATGDALVVDNCGYPGGTPSVSVTGGSFVSENARAVGSYANGDDAETGAAREPVGGFIDPAGTALFSDAGADGVPEGHELVADEANPGFYKVVVSSADAVASVTTSDGTVSYYLSLSEAVAAARTGEKVTLLADVALDGFVNVSKALSFDLAGHALTRDGTSPSSVVFYVSAPLELLDSAGGGSATVTGTQGRAVWLVPGGVLTLRGGAVSGPVGIDAQGGSLVVPADSTAVVSSSSPETWALVSAAAATNAVAGGFFAGGVAVEVGSKGFVSGGFFSEPVPDAACAAGYAPSSATTTVSGSEWHTVAAGDFAAKVLLSKTAMTQVNPSTGKTSNLYRTDPFTGVRAVAYKRLYSFHATFAEALAAQRATGSAYSHEITLLKDCGVYDLAAPTDLDNTGIEYLYISADNTVNETGSWLRFPVPTGYVVVRATYSAGKSYDAHYGYSLQLADFAVGGNLFRGLLNAYRAASDGDTIRPLFDTRCGGVSLGEDKAVTIDLDGHNVIGNLSISKGTVTVTGDGVLEYQAARANTPVVKVTGSGAFVLDGTNAVLRNPTDYGIWVYGATASAAVKAGEVVGVTTALYVEKGSAAVEGGTLKLADASATGSAYLVNALDANWKNGAASISATGGTFYNGFNPASKVENAAPWSYAPTYYGVYDAATDSYTLVAAAAQLNGLGKESLPIANAEAAEGDTIVLLGDTAFTEESLASGLMLVQQEGQTYAPGDTYLVARAALVTWCDWDGTVLYATNCAVGTVPEYVGELPFRPSDTSAVYAFAGWTPAVAAVEGDTV